MVFHVITVTIIWASCRTILHRIALDIGHDNGKADKLEAKQATM